MTLSGYIKRTQKTTYLNAIAVASVYDNLCESLSPLQDYMDTMGCVRDKAVLMYILSNKLELAWAPLMKTYECFSWCSGHVIPCEAHLIKSEFHVRAGRTPRHALDTAGEHRLYLQPERLSVFLIRNVSYIENVFCKAVCLPLIGV